MAALTQKTLTFTNDPSFDPAFEIEQGQVFVIPDNFKPSKLDLVMVTDDHLLIYLTGENAGLTNDDHSEFELTRARLVTDLAITVTRIGGAS